MLVSKLSKVFDAMDAGNWRLAISIASKFANLGEQKAHIMRAQSAINNPHFYRQLGKDPDAIIARGKTAMRERFEPMRRPTP